MISTTSVLTLALAFFGAVAQASPVLGPGVEIEMNKRQVQPTFFIKSRTITGTVSPLSVDFLHPHHVLFATPL